MKAFVAKRAASTQQKAAHAAPAKKASQLSGAKLDAIKQKVVAATLAKLKAKKAQMAKGKASLKAPAQLVQAKSASVPPKGAKTSDMALASAFIKSEH